MSLPFTDPSLPSAPAPIFGDIDAARGDHLRANNSLIWSNLNYLEAKIVNVIAPVGTERLLITQSDSSASVARFTNSTTTTAASRGTEFGIDASEQGRIWNYENTDLIIGTNNTTRLTLTAAGLFQVSATTYIASDLYLQKGSSPFLGAYDNFKLRLGVNNTEYAGINTSGYMNVGGSHSASNPLHVQSTTTPQVRIAYDGTYYTTFGVDSNGRFDAYTNSHFSFSPGSGSFQVFTSGINAQIISIDSGGTKYISMSHNGTNGAIGTAGTSAGNIVIANTTEATSSTAAALISSGGIAAAKNICVGGDLCDASGNPVAGWLADGTPYYKKRIAINDWNMDSTASVSVAHGLTLSKILGVTVMIRNDADESYYTLLYSSDTALGGGWISGINSTNVILYRITGGIFDTSTFDSTSYNRGYVTIDYIA